MKRISFMFFAIFALTFANAQRSGVATRSEMADPTVTISAINVTPTEMSFQIIPNAECATYEYFLSQTAELDMWMLMLGGVTLDQLVHQWGASSSGIDTVYYDDQTPNTAYTFCVLPYDAQGNSSSVITYELTSGSIGGSGTSVISIAVDSITSTSALVTFTPNDQTAFYKDMILTDSLYQAWGEDSTIYYLQEDFYVYYTEDAWTWAGLIPGTDYWAAAIGQNADGAWGELATYPFTTLGSVSITENEATSFTISPVPNDGNFMITGADLNGHRLAIFTLDGKMVFNTVLDSNMATLSTGLASGTYLVAVETAAGVAPSCRKMIVY